MLFVVTLNRAPFLSRNLLTLVYLDYFQAGKSRVYSGEIRQFVWQTIGTLRDLAADWQFQCNGRLQEDRSQSKNTEGVKGDQSRRGTPKFSVQNIARTCNVTCYRVYIEDAYWYHYHYRYFQRSVMLLKFVLTTRLRRDPASFSFLTSLF